MSIIADEAFYDLDGPLVRITTPHIPLPAADILEDAILPTVDRIVDRVRRTLNSLARCHSGRGRRPEPGIQWRVRSMFRISGSALRAAPE